MKKELTIETTTLKALEAKIDVLENELGQLESEKESIYHRRALLESPIKPGDIVTWRGSHKGRVIDVNYWFQGSDSYEYTVVSILKNGMEGKSKKLRSYHQVIKEK